jgi:hypothetical protein
MDLKEAGTEARACLVCWDLLVSFYFYNGRHKVRYNGRILCARVAPALLTDRQSQCDFDFDFGQRNEIRELELGVQKL